MLEAILTNTVQLHHKDWVNRISEALGYFKNTWRNTTVHATYELVYGKQVLLPIQFQVKTFWMAMHLGIYLYEAQKQRVMHLNELNEIHQDAIQHSMLIEDQRDCWHDQLIKKNISI